MAVPSINLAGLNLSGLANLGGLGTSRSVTSSAASQRASNARAASSSRPSVSARPTTSASRTGGVTAGRPTAGTRPVAGGVGTVRPAGRIGLYSREDLPPDTGPMPGRVGPPAPVMTPGEEAQQQQQRGGYERGAGLVGRFSAMGTRDGRFKAPASDLAQQLAKRKLRQPTFAIETM